MTTEEKAKTYDEMVQRVKELHEAGNALTKKQMEIILPELTESEDEKNANALIRLLNNEKVSSLITFEAKQQWLNWLERQKEPHTKRNALFDKCVENCDPEIMKRVSDEIDAKLQKEQKPSEWSEEDYASLNKFELLAKSSNLPKDIVYWAMEHLSPLQNSTNSEIPKECSKEDKLMLQCCLQAVKSYEYNAKRGEFLPAQFNIGGYLTTPKKVTDWLKSLPERFNPQPKQEVTDEEIEEMVTKRSRSSGTTKSEMAFYRNGIKDAIKRFGLRHSWKPSEEQMEELSKACRFIPYNCDILESLYEQIEKLEVKEEPEYYQHFDPDC